MQKLTQAVMRAFRKDTRTSSDGLRTILSALRALIRRGGKLAGMPHEVKAFPSRQDVERLIQFTGKALGRAQAVCEPQLQMLGDLDAFMGSAFAPPVPLP